MHSPMMMIKAKGWRTSFLTSVVKIFQILFMSNFDAPCGGKSFCQRGFLHNPDTPLYTLFACFENPISPEKDCTSECFCHIALYSPSKMSYYFQSFFFFPPLVSFESVSVSEEETFSDAWRLSPVISSNWRSSSFASGFNLSGTCTTSVT